MEGGGGEVVGCSMAVTQATEGVKPMRDTRGGVGRDVEPTSG